MAYVLFPDEPAGAELVRVLDMQFSEAASLIHSGVIDARVIHELRKHTKRMRAALFLLRPVGPNAREAERAARDAARAIADVRDADAIALAVGLLTHAEPDDVRMTEKLLFERRHERFGSDAVTARLHRAELLLDASALLVTRIRSDQLDDVAAGVGAAYGRAQAAFEAARQRRVQESMHRFRRHVKRHWYHCELLGARTSGFAGRATQLGLLSEKLGEAHDLGVLAEVLAAEYPSVEDRLLQPIRVEVTLRWKVALHHAETLFDRPEAELTQAASAG